MPAKLHVQFAAGAIEPMLLARTAPADRPDWTARRDLARYYSVLAAELACIHFTRHQSELLVQALPGRILESAKLLWAEVDQALAESDEVTGREREALVAKLRDLTPSQSLSVLDAVERYWTMPPRDRGTRALVFVGLANGR